MNAEREARKKQLEAAKQKLATRRKARENLRRLKEDRPKGLPFSKNDYGQSLIEKVKEFTSDLNKQSELESSLGGIVVINNGIDVPGPRVELSLSSDINTIEFNKRKTVEYAKEIQTDSLEIAQHSNLLNEQTSDKEITSILVTFNEIDTKPWPPSKPILEESSSINDFNDNKDENNDNLDEINNEDLNNLEDKKEDGLIMSEDDAFKLMSENVFFSSFRAKSLLMDHILGVNEEHSIFYEINEMDNENENENQIEKLLLNKTFFDKSMKDRSITNLHLSSVNSEYLLASHSSLSLLNGYFLQQSDNINGIDDLNNMNDTEGIINIWNTKKSIDKPMYELICQSMVTTAKFHPTNPNLVIAATVSGQVLGWDMRTKTTPIMRTQFSSGHSAPVFSMDFIGNNTSNNNDDDEKTIQKPTRGKQAKHIITVSNDAKVCVWRDDFLVNPLIQYSLKLVVEKENKSSSDEKSNTISTTTTTTTSSTSNDDLSTTCFSSLNRIGNAVIFGSDEGCLYKCNENISSDAFLSGNISNFNSISNNNKVSSYNNFGIGSDSNNSSSNNSIDLMVTGLNNYIVDESNKGSNKRFAHFGPITNVDCHPSFSQLYLSSSYDWTIKLWHNKKSKPLFTFNQMADYIYDVKWSPVKPSVFVCGDGLGKITVFDLINDFESPITQLSTIDENSKKQVSITRLEWQKDGKCLFVGDSNGQVLMYDVNPSLYETSENDFNLFESVIRTAVNQV